MLLKRSEALTTGENHGGYLAGHCMLCGDSGWLKTIKHKKGCILQDPGVTHISLTGYKAKIVISGPRRSDGKLWWKSCGGVVYDIEKRGGRYFVMHERKSGKCLVDSSRLSDIRKYIKDNQGRL